jgi:ATP-dependent Lhr-like helicase
LGVSTDRVRAALEALETEGRLTHGEFRPAGIEREWCDVEVLRRIRQRSLAALRREVEPVDAPTLGRFLPAWQGADHPSGGADALVDAVTRLQGAALPASILETDVLPARVRGYRGADLDALCAGGELVWVGAGALGHDDGRVMLCFRDQARALLTGRQGGDDRPGSDLHEAIRAQLAERGASFWGDLVQAAGVADERRLLAALWDLVWSGEVTNDTLAPLRAFVRGASAKVRASRPGSRPRPGGLRRAGPPAGAGRWSLVAPLLEPAAPPTEAAHARALQLLDRHGVVTRESVLAESAPGGFAGVYPVLKAMEESGKVRRGYFVAGLGAAQFALPGAIDRLRALRGPTQTPLDDDDPEVGAVLAAADPAQPYGAALAWPPAEGRPARQAGAYVVLAAGSPVAYLERGARSLLTFGTDPQLWTEPLASLVKDGRLRKIELHRIDGAPAVASPHLESLHAAGFADGYRGLTLRG